MASKLIHLHNATTGIAPTTLELGRLAINHADGKIFVSNAAGTGVLTFFAGAAGTVKSVNTVSPDGAGAVTLTPANLGATSVGNSLFTAANAGAARTVLGSTAVGDALFTAASAGAARSTLGATTVGDAVLTAASTDAAQTSLGGTSVGKAVFTAVNAAAATTAIGAVPTTSLGAANGVAQLDSSAKVPLSQLPDAVLGGVSYQGTFDATTGSVAAAAAGNKGWYYVVTVSGSYTPPSQSALNLTLGDWLISNGVIWDKVDAVDGVTSVAGKTGVVLLDAGDTTTGTFTAARLGSAPGNSRVLTTDSSGNPTFVSTVPTLNLPVGTAAALGVAQAGVGLTAAAGVFAVDTSVLTMDEGTYS